MPYPDHWYKSSHSTGANECVEVREHAVGADIRDTQNRELGHLAFPAGEWASLVDSLRR
ncbi:MULTISPECIES: DUF397 domain-containing protein [unclassified Nocardiopsis]|uniref:DUF397 domain-containing protein n=1 Tax=Nocardiopsis TaxID=2013 RepID=UPI00387ABCD3